jgi:hypothetical protein
VLPRASLAAIAGRTKAGPNRFASQERMRALAEGAGEK